jgi:uncharacterized membrane protein YqjE
MGEAYRGEEGPAPKSLTSAIEHVVTSSQRLLVDRIDLLLLEAREDTSTAVRGAALTLGGAILLFYGWITAVAWVVDLLWGALPLAAVLGAVTAFHVIGGAVLGWLSMRTLGGIRPLRPDDVDADRRERQVLSAGIRGAA